MNETRLFTLAGAQTRDPAVQSWFAAPPSELRAMALRWFDEIRGCGEDVLEVLHDGHPTACVGDLAFAYVNAFRSHVNVGFYFGTVLSDPAGLLQGSGRFMRHVKLSPGTPTPEAALRKLIVSAYSDVKARLPRRSGAGL